MSIGTLVFILAFIVIGLAVVLVAMRGGRRNGEAQSPASRRMADRATGVGLALGIVVIGLGVPAAVIATNPEQTAEQGPGGVELSDTQANSRKVFALRCGNCHTLAATASVGRVGPNLDVMRPPKELVVNAIEQGRARGNGQMPAMILSGEEAVQVADFVQTVAGR
jgi:mono/diheme cytochrome c family protein